MTDRLFNAWMHKFDRGTDFHQTHSLSFQICVCTNMLSANVSPPALKTNYEELGCQAVNFSIRTKETPNAGCPIISTKIQGLSQKRANVLIRPQCPLGYFAPQSAIFRLIVACA